jgi:mono/diheme cytochrome c family protein
MTHVAVTRALFTLVAALFAVALLFGVVVRRAPSPSANVPVDLAPGEAGYATYCGACHTLDFTVQYVRAAPTVESGAAALAEFLRGHGNAPDADQAAIVATVAAHARR